MNAIGYTGGGDRSSERKSFILEELPRSGAKIEAEIQDESDDIPGQRVKTIIPSDVFDVWTRLGV